MTIWPLLGNIARALRATRLAERAYRRADTRAERIRAHRAAYYAAVTPCDRPDCHAEWDRPAATPPAHPCPQPPQEADW